MKSTLQRLEEAMSECPPEQRDIFATAYRDHERLLRQLHRLYLESTHFKNEGIGKMFLESCLEQTQGLLKEFYKPA